MSEEPFVPRHHRPSSFALVVAFAGVMLAPAVAAAQWGPWGPYYPYPYGRYQAESSLRIDVKPKDAEVFVERLCLYTAGCLVFHAGRTIAGYVISHPWRARDPRR